MQGILQAQHQEGDEVRVQEGGKVQGGQDLQEQVPALQTEQVLVHGNEQGLLVCFYIILKVFYFVASTAD